MKSRTILSVVVAALFGVVAFIFVQFSDGGRVGIPRAEACTENGSQCLPKVTFVDTEGHKYTPEELAGKIVIVNFFATWCHPCQGEIPDLARVYSKYKDRGVVLLGVMTDDPSVAALGAFAQRFGINYPVVRSDGSIESAFGSPDAMPTTFIYDRSGHVKFARPGALTGGELGELLDGLVGG